MSAQEHGAYRRKPALARAANERIAQRAARLRFAARVPLLCECADPSCRELIRLDLEEYRRIRAEPSRYVTAAGHDV
jgi:hypothetical protein